MQQQTLPPQAETSRFSELIGLIIPFAFRKIHHRKVVVDMKKMSRRYRPGAPPAGMGGGSYNVPEIRIMTPEGMVWFDVSPRFYALVNSGDHIFISYQISRRVRINQAIKIWPMSIRFSPLVL